MLNRKAGGAIQRRTECRRLGGSLGSSAKEPSATAEVSAAIVPIPTEAMPSRSHADVVAAGRTA